MAKNYHQRLMILVILLTLLVVLIGKLFFRTENPNILFYVYGSSVTIVIFVTFITVFFAYKDPYEKVRIRNFSKQKKPPYVSIILAVRNEEVVIGRCLDSLIAQTYPRRKIYVVNDASSDRTAEILDAYAAKGEITVIHRRRNVGKKRAIATAMARATGDYFAFTDSDTVIESDAIEKMVAVMYDNPKIGAVNGHVRALNAQDSLLTKIQDTWYEGQFSIRKSFESIFGAVTCVSGPLAMFRREAIYNYIPAWTHDTFLGKEFRFSTDRSLTNFVLSSASIGPKLKKRHQNSPFVRKKDYPIQDWLVVYTACAHAWTVVPDTFHKVIRQQIRWKKSFIRSIFLTGRYFYKKPLPVALVYYLHILFVLLGPIISFRHLIYLPLTGNLLSAWLYLAGICYVGLLFGLAYRLRIPGNYRWLYRPLMSILSTLVFSWLIFYSALTIKKSLWHRG